jgi:uncharacterized protein (TIGR03790 family)
MQSAASLCSHGPRRHAVLIVLAALWSQGALHAEIAPENVLVLYSADQGVSGDGYQIAAYYHEVHPGVHTLGITGLNQALMDTANETISAEKYLEIIRPQVLAGIGSLGKSIDVIVTTKGMPLKIDAGTKGSSETPLWKRYSSLESELSRIDSISTRDAMGDQFIYTGFPDLDPRLPSNPYYNSNEPFVRAGSDPINADMRLAARLDGFNLETVKDSIDRAQRVFVATGGSTIIADDDPTAGTDQMIDIVPGGPGPGLLNAAQAAGYGAIYDNTDDAITMGKNIIGYVSHGVNDDHGGLEAGYLTNQLQLRLQRGAVFLTHESFNATSFSPDYVSSQGLIADWLEIGGTAGLGHVHEPTNGSDNVTNEDIFFANMLPRAGSPPGTAGLSFVEAAWSATRQLSYVNTVVGDPLMTWRSWLHGDTNLDGKVEYKDFYTFEENWQKSGTFAEGDFNSDGRIDALDFGILSSNWFADMDLAELSASDFQVVPRIDLITGLPTLSARLLSSANFDGDLDVDEADLSRILTWYGRNRVGDVDGDRDTDGRDFLAWQRQFFEYDFSADFEIDAVVGAGDLSVWQSSYDANRGGDADGDGDSDGRDFLIWQREFNAAANVLATAMGTVPEPGSLGLAMWLIFVEALASRRGRGNLKGASSSAR